ncbi:FUSC family protein [Bradyrhizobium japonicum]
MEGAQLPGDATSADIRPRFFAGFPVSSWAFALRVLLAMLLALYVSFWLELESPRRQPSRWQSWRCPRARRAWKRRATGCSQPSSA